MPKILVADDNTNIQKMVSLALEERGINVVSVGNGEAAVRRIPDVDPDLVLADIFMPVRNGYEVCEFVKKDERFAHVPVILLVGAFDPLDEKEARRVGADGVLKKPFVPPDPLIAMVTSALEKNPRVAAEMAKANEVKLPPEPDSLPNVDLSLRPEPKPLPEFPELSPDEAALVYGMGKGQRSLDPQEQSYAAGEPESVGVPRDPEGGDDGEDAASTASDWRRTAMDLEIPADLANRPALPSTDDLEPISFPSEKEFPPRRVHAPEPGQEARETSKSERAEDRSEFSLRQVEESDPAVESELLERSGDLAETPRMQGKAESEPPGVHPARDAVPHPGPLPEPNSTAPGGHWLDAVSSAQANPLAGGWMEALNPQRTEQHEGALPELESNESSVDAAGESSIEMGSSASPSPGVFAAPVSSADSYQHPAEEKAEPQAEARDDQSFFADDPAHETAASAPRHYESSAGVPGLSESTGRDLELDVDDSEPPLAFKDPALVEPPAVRIAPEPLLVNEEATAPARYGVPSEEPAPAHSFFAPAPDIPPAAAEFSVHDQSGNSGQSGGEGDERIPTMVPPNREALAHIPFLTPPPSFLAELKSAGPQQGTRTNDPETVDTVVQKVLEKLQPQLQELLSQGLLKPLVENILQSELTKKH